MSGPTVYRYFPNKYVLAAELRRRLDEAEEQAAVPAVERIETTSSLTAAVDRWVRATADARGAQPAALLLRSMSATVPDLSLSEADPDGVLRALMAALQRLQPALTANAAAERARAIRTSVDSLIDDAMRDGRPSAQQLALIVELATTMINAAAAAPAESLSGRAD